MEFLFFVALVVLTVVVFRQRSHVRQLTDRVQDLTARIYAAEQALTVRTFVEPEPVAEPVPEPVVDEPPPLPAYLPVPDLPPPVIPPLVIPPLVLEPQAAGPSWRDRFQGEEWEALLGGSILNKLGALILVIGLALFLRFSLDALGPAGKIGVGVFTGGALIAAGMWLERQPRYKVFSIGLLSAGWAMLYFTAFAAHGIPESRVIESPAGGLLVLLLVGAAMVWRSLRYESEWVTGLAFFAAFAALQVDPGSPFALVASAILAAGLLAISARFGWRIMPLAGILLAYTTIAFLPPRETFLLGIGHPILWVYWLLFELFDHWRSRRAPLVTPLDAVQYVLNTLAFIAASLLTARGVAPEHYSSFLGLAAVAFAISAFFRRHRLVDQVEERWWNAAGLSLAATSAVAAAAILLRFHGLSATLALFIEGQALFVLAWRSPAPMARWVAVAISALAMGKLLFVDDARNGLITWLGYRMNAVTPMGALMAAGFYINRFLLPLRVYSWAASILAAFVLASEVPHGFVFAAWAAEAAVLAFVAHRHDLRELRYQAYALTPGVVMAMSYTLFDQPHTSWTAWALFSAAYAYLGWRWRVLREGHERLAALSVSWQFVAFGGATLLWTLLPGTLAAPAWGLLALVMVEAGVLTEFPELRRAGHTAALAAFGRLFMSNFPALGYTGPFSHRLLTVAPFLPLYYYLWSRSRARFYLWLPPVLALFLMRMEIGRAHSGSGSIVASLLLLWWGLRLTIPDLRWQAYLLAVAAFLRAWSLSFSLAEAPFRLAAGLLVVAGLFLGHHLANRDPLAKFERWAKPIYAILGAALLAGILYSQVSGPMLTVAWSIEGVALLIAGFVTAERVMRFSGLGFFLFCILKLFFYDLASLQGLPRIASFIVLGVLLMAASWLYTRYREQLKRIL
ncbi:MAG: DUF2339 domain-containing protein [Bryobacteraceae bacterium]|nr:DUF2339 domain-containing protein [Bryobacteraceae bacterium]